MIKLLDRELNVAVREAVKQSVFSAWQQVMAVDGSNKLNRRKKLHEFTLQPMLEDSLNQYLDYLADEGWLKKMAKDAKRARSVSEAVWTDRMSAFGIQVDGELWENFFFDTDNYRFTDVYVAQQFFHGTTLGAAKDTFANMGVGISWTLRMPSEVLQALDNHSRASTIQLDSVMQSAIDKILFEEFYRDGRGPEEVARVIRNRFSSMSKLEAHNIAHLQTLEAAMLGQHTTMKMCGVDEKRWMARAFHTINNPRPSHAVADGQTTGIDDTFIVGQSRMLYPGDPAGANCEKYNCHCTMVPIIDKRVQKYIGEMDLYFKNMDPEMRRGGAREDERWAPTQERIDKVYGEMIKNLDSKSPQRQLAKIPGAIASRALQEAK